MGGTFPRGAEPFSLCVPFFRVSQRISAARDLRTRAPPALTRAHRVTYPQAHSHTRTRLACPPGAPQRLSRGKRRNNPNSAAPCSICCAFLRHNKSQINRFILLITVLSVKRNVSPRLGLYCANPVFNHGCRLSGAAPLRASPHPSAGAATAPRPSSAEV